MSMDPQIIAAFVDGELDEMAARRIEREAEHDAELAAEIARHRALKAALAQHYAPVAAEPIPDRLAALLAADDKVVSLADRRATAPARFGAMQWGAMAAALILGLTIGLRPWMTAADVAADGGILVADGALAKALDTQLASNQPAGAPVRIGLSFQDRAGRTCRSFESTTIDGISCREDGRWSIEHMLRGGRSGAYRQASSGDLASAAAQMMVGAPFDAAAERAARDRGWRR